MQIDWDEIGSDKYVKIEKNADFDNDLLEEMINGVDLVDYFSNNENLPLTQHSPNLYKAHCPFSDHDDLNESFVIYEDTNSFFCFGCKKGGKIFQWLLDASGKNMNFVNAVELVANLTGISPNLDVSGSLDRLKENIENIINEENDHNLFTKNELNLIISKMGYNHIKNNNFSQKEILFAENIYKVWDYIFNNYDKYRDKHKQVKKMFISKFKKRKILLENETEEL